MRAYQGDPEQLRGLLPGEIATLPDGRLQRADGHIDADAAYVVVEVADTGVGMNQEVMQRIYEPFFTTKPTGQGTGLGLPVVHGIVQAHGGVIEIVSGPGAGAVFRIWLPQARAAGVQTPVAAPTAHDIAHDRGYVLVVDDDGHFGDMVAVTLERLGCEVAVIQHPTEALAAFESSTDLWQLVICDRMMPDINGLDLIRRIKARRPDLPCILCTGLGKPDGQSEATAAGADAYLQKPIAAGVLEAVVKRLLGSAAPPS
jgi:CheY-like chemotaxis protein